MQSSQSFHQRRCPSGPPPGALPALVPAALLALLLLAAAGLPGCGTTREAAPPPVAGKVVVSEGARFRLPDGWLDFSRDSLRTGILWLVRKDFRASLGVEEVHGAGDPADLAGVARALLRLETANRGGRVVSPPAEEQESGGRAFAFQLVRDGGDEVRVAVVRRGGKTYAVTAVQRKEAPTPFTELLGVQRSVVDDLLR